MKKVFLLLTVSIFITTLSMAQLSVGLEGGAGLVLNENTKDLSDAGWDVSKLSITAFGEVGYQLPATINIPNLGESSIVVGGKIGYLTGTRASLDDASYAWNTVPLYLFGRAEAGFIYTDIGLGLHAWFMSLDFGSMDFEDNGLDFSAYLKSGLKFDLSESLSLKAGIAIHSLAFDFEDDSDNILTLGADIGFSIKF